jgi:starch phosphorylase
VRDYVRRLYAPAAGVARALNDDYAGARDLAAWKQRVRAAWSGVRVEHVESSGVGDAPEVGAVMSARAFLALGSLTPEAVSVKQVHGRASADDEQLETKCTVLTVAESYEGGRHRFDGEVALDHAGAFGYTVRVVPRHDLLASDAELGVVALPAPRGDPPGGRGLMP